MVTANLSFAKPSNLILSSSISEDEDSELSDLDERLWKPRETAKTGASIDANTTTTSELAPQVF